jgi:hypothetical protein
VGGVSYALHGEVPVLVHEGLVADGEEGDMPGPDVRRRRVYREELDVQGVQVVCGISDGRRIGTGGPVPIGIMHSQ